MVVDFYYSSTVLATPKHWENNPKVWWVWPAQRKACNVHEMAAHFTKILCTKPRQIFIRITHQCVFPLLYDFSFCSSVCLSFCLHRFYFLICNHTEIPVKQIYSRSVVFLRLYQKQKENIFKPKHTIHCFKYV